MNTTLDDIYKICLPEFNIKTDIITSDTVNTPINKVGSILLEIDSFRFY
jgi:hypothetical protein